MSKLVANYGGGASDEYGTFAVFNRFLSGDVVEGFTVVPNGTPNMTVKVSPGSGRITTGAYPSSYGYLVNHDTTGGESVTISTAAASARIDFIVAYIDKGVVGATSPVNNANGVLKFAAVAGTPSGSPVVPTASQIQSAIGAANPYIVLAQIAVAATVTTITAPNITDVRVLVYPTNGSTLGYAQITSNFTQTAGGVTAVTGLSVTVNVPAGKRLKLTAFSGALYYPGGNSAVVTMSLWEGTPGSGTHFADANMFGTNASSQSPGTAIAIITPSAGAHTYNVGLQTSNITNASAGIGAAATSPAFILVENI
ncbi:hypothetical protein [Subtercola sp. RTI3]|uniref:hypothetical protein n=1 Tax=Subtercola sp. RTI3 TaxID=3048639 RepID=UPI002B228E63|nr:hypothetical protein [Subtercola sp. RTI3]MEA9986263.1 hypothetical protein [Subtercola sp. RTI3]